MLQQIKHMPLGSLVSWHLSLSHGLNGQISVEISGTWRHGEEEWEQYKNACSTAQLQHTSTYFKILQHTSDASICLFHLLRNKIAGCVAVLEKGLTMRYREKRKFKTSRWSIVHCEAAFVTCWWVCLASTASASGPSRSALKCWTTKTQKSLVPEVLQISSWQNQPEKVSCQPACTSGTP